MTRITPINLSALPLPSAVEPLSFEVILASLKTRLTEIAPQLAPVLALESDPLVKELEAFAYYLLLSRASGNDKVRAVHLATATGSNLDNLVALFGVERLTITPADPEAVPPVAEVLEGDDALRLRCQLALDGFSTAGSRASYEFHARTASGEVADVLVDNPSPGTVRVVILSAVGTGAANPALIATVEAALNAEEVRPLCDTVVVQSAVIVPFTVSATLIIQQGPDPAVVLAEADGELNRMLAERRAVGRSIPQSAIYGALYRPGVERVTITAPLADIDVGPTEVAHCGSATIQIGVGP